MAAQSIAELIAKEKKELSVLFAALNGRKSVEYMCESVVPIDEFKIRLKSGIGIDKSMLSANKKIDNLYIISGLDKEEEARSFLPEMADVLIQSLNDKFNLIIIDAGSEIDNGLAYGAVKMNGLKYLVIEQSESSVARYEKMKEIYDRLNINFDKYILSKYYSDDPLSVNYISSRLSLNKSSFFEIGYSDKGRASEMEYRTLLEAGQDKYCSDIVKIANDMMAAMNLESILLKRKRAWNSFI